MRDRLPAVGSRPTPTMIAVALPAEQLEELAVRVVELLAEREADRPALLDRRGLARALSVSPDTLDKMRKEPGFPELRVVDAPRFELSEVIVWMRGRGGGAQ